MDCFSPHPSPYLSTTQNTHPEISTNEASTMGRFTPPLVFTTETKDVIICFSGGGGVQARPLHKPLRQATKGQFSIYGSFDNADTSIVIAMSFEEDKLPVLGRQTYYHFLDPSDFFWDEKGWIEFGLHNYIATTTEKEVSGRLCLSG